jgi:hypothetical protein
VDGAQHIAKSVKEAKEGASWFHAAKLLAFECGNPSGQNTEGPTRADISPYVTKRRFISRDCHAEDRTGLKTRSKKGEQFDALKRPVDAHLTVSPN